MRRVGKGCDDDRMPGWQDGRIRELAETTVAGNQYTAGNDDDTQTMSLTMAVSLSLSLLLSLSPCLCPCCQWECDWQSMPAQFQFQLK